MEQFEPRIIGFLCRWCSYTGADLAGTSRIKYPPNMIPVRVMCSGRVDPTFVLRALSGGADGVLIAGCHPGDCHYLEGNYKMLRRYPLLQRLLEQFGIDPRRVRLEWISASEGERFAQVVRELIEEVRALGPLAWNQGAPAEETASALEEAMAVEGDGRRDAAVAAAEVAPGQLAADS